MAPVQSVILSDGELDLDGNKKYLVVIRAPHFFHIKGVGGLGTSVDAQQLKKRKFEPLRDNLKPCLRLLYFTYSLYCLKA